VCLLLLNFVLDLTVCFKFCKHSEDVKPCTAALPKLNYRYRYLKHAAALQQSTNKINVWSSSRFSKFLCDVFSKLQFFDL